MNSDLAWSFHLEPPVIFDDTQAAKFDCCSRLRTAMDHVEGLVVQRRAHMHRAKIQGMSLPHEL